MPPTDQCLGERTDCQSHQGYNKGREKYPGNHVIVGGDFNARLGTREVDDPCPGFGAAQSDARGAPPSVRDLNGELLIQLAARVTLTQAATWLSRPHHPAGTPDDWGLFGHTLDHLLVPLWMLQQGMVSEIRMGARHGPPAIIAWLTYLVFDDPRAAPKAKLFIGGQASRPRHDPKSEDGPLLGGKAGSRPGRSTKPSSTSSWGR